MKNKHSSNRWVLFAIAGLLLLVTLGCSKRKTETSDDDARSNPPTISANHFDGGTYCVQTITQGPPLSKPIHFSNKENQSDGSSKDFESALSGDKFDVTIHERHPATDFDRENNTIKGVKPISIVDGFAESVNTNHYTRSDASGWSMGITSVAQGGTPWGVFISKPPVTQVGTESISGYDTIKYTVDTTHQSQLDKAALLMFGKLKDYNIVGTAWVVKDLGCVLQYTIDYEEDGKDGKVSKTHYEGGITRQ